MTNSAKPRATHLKVVKDDEGVLPKDGIPLTALDKENISRLQALADKQIPVHQLLDLKGTYLVALIEEILGYDGIVSARAKHAKAVSAGIDDLEAQLNAAQANAAEEQRKAILLQGVRPQ